MRHDGRSRQRNERDDHPQREQQHAVGLNGRNRRWSVCKPDGGDEPTKADVAQRLFRGRREASDCSYRYWKDGKQRWLGLGSQKEVSLGCV